MTITDCYFCAQTGSDEAMTLNGHPICRMCAHLASHPRPLAEGEIPCPVINEKHEVIPWGIYPNLDWS